jgi:intracellular multiplication protein IcmP
LARKEARDLERTVCERHAYVETALASALVFARECGGVLASAEFLWLKPVDRGLWYVMNNVGRRAFHPEAAGAMAHWKYELARKAPERAPHVDEAVEAMIEFLELQHAHE